ncbi:MAG: hypothetical protein L0H84_09255 [Pseudonocardia sp.]|nr:hypothetical protein [Pseudonocardia sp.]
MRLLDRVAATAVPSAATVGMSPALHQPYPVAPPLAELLVDDQQHAAVALGVVLVTLPADHPLVVAARLALDLRDHRHATREAGLDVHAGHLELVERILRGGQDHIVQPGVGRERRGLPGPTYDARATENRERKIVDPKAQVKDPTVRADLRTPDQVPILGRAATLAREAS